MTSQDLPKTYDFNNTEQRTYQEWERKGYFRPWNDPNKPGFDPSVRPFVITIPPPNLTGELHLGHVMFVAMEDLMIRYQRMKGIPTLWIPGSDHAGIAMQLQIEKMLRNEGTSREEIGREEFLRRAWEWKHKYGSLVTNQIRRIGASCDWDRERFTLDDGLSRAVREAFVRLYEKGLIYRGPRLINWSPGLKTAVSDLEVVYSEEPGVLYYFKYLLAPGQGFSEGEYLPVATTRPETLLGDTAVAVHPDDPRYQAFIGYKVLVPMLGRQIPVIADDYVDREFGGGVLKVTPGHDPNDFRLGEKHGLEVISILDEAAVVNQNGGPYAGLDRFVARKQLWEDMGKAGLVLKEVPYTLNVPRSQRGGEIIEPMVSTQWFINIKPLAESALEAVRDGRVQIIPERFTKVYYNWMENIQDWCISRQLWWGHRIPVWYCQGCSEMIAAREDPAHCPHCGSAELIQDPDVLDTWFSSGLWPFSTLGWPDDTPDYRYFYPTSLLETGYDILFFWVARMIMDGLEFTGQAPFHTVYLHGLIRDEIGQKMSKTYGNVIDPLQVMDEFGTDALRFTLLVGSSPGNDMNLSLKKVEANRNFANKLWNATRFVLAALANLPAATGPAIGPESVPNTAWTLADSWIWSRLQAVIRDTNRLFESHQYGEAGRQIYDFFWGEFADWYVEIAKLQLSQAGQQALITADALARVLDLSLRLLHPFIPFITEELWGRLKTAVAASPLQYSLDADALIIASWPQPRAEAAWEAAVISDFTAIQEVIRTIRNLRSEKAVKPGRRIPAILASNEKSQLLRQQSSVIAALAGLDPNALQILDHSPAKAKGMVSAVAAAIEIYLPISGLVDANQERERLLSDLAETTAQIERLEKLLGGSFAEKAPPAVVQKERDRLEAFRQTAEKIRNQLE